MNDNRELITTTPYVGEVSIGDRKIPCAVLFPDTDNPVRVFIQREVVGLLTGNKKGGLERYLKPQNLKPFVPIKFKEGISGSVFKFKLNGKEAHGFVGDDLIDLCKMYFDARKVGVLHVSQEKLADMAEIIVFSFAKTGVSAVIDEVTGYQDVRVKGALEKILNDHLINEAKPYIGTFPLEFYKQIFRLREWEWTVEAAKFGKRPGVVSRYTNDIIYSRITPGLLSELQKRNPIIRPGQRKHKNFQFLSDDKGDPALMSHFDGVIALMKASYSWDHFYTLLDRVYPKFGETLKMQFPEVYREEPKNLSTHNQGLKKALNYNPKGK